MKSAGRYAHVVQLAFVLEVDGPMISISEINPADQHLSASLSRAIRRRGDQHTIRRTESAVAYYLHIHGIVAQMPKTSRSQHRTDRCFYGKVSKLQELEVCGRKCSSRRWGNARPTSAGPVKIRSCRIDSHAYKICMPGAKAMPAGVLDGGSTDHCRSRRGRLGTQHALNRPHWALTRAWSSIMN